MVALRKLSPEYRHSQASMAPLPTQPAVRPRQVSKQIYKEHNVQIYALVWGFAFYMLTSTLYTIFLGSLEPIYFMGLISISLMMLVNALGEQLGLARWFRIMAAFAMGWLVPAFMTGLYFFKNHLAI